MFYKIRSQSKHFKQKDLFHKGPAFYLNFIWLAYWLLRMKNNSPSLYFKTRCDAPKRFYCEEMKSSHEKISNNALSRIKAHSLFNERIKSIADELIEIGLCCFVGSQTASSIIDHTQGVVGIVISRLRENENLLGLFKIVFPMVFLFLVRLGRSLILYAGSQFYRVMFDKVGWIIKYQFQVPTPLFFLKLPHSVNFFPTSNCQRWLRRLSVLRRSIGRFFGKKLRFRIPLKNESSQPSFDE